MASETGKFPDKDQLKAAGFAALAAAPSVIFGSLLAYHTSETNLRVPDSPTPEQRTWFSTATDKETLISVYRNSGCIRDQNGRHCELLRSRFTTLGIKVPER